MNFAMGTFLFKVEIKFSSLNDFQVSSLDTWEL